MNIERTENIYVGSEIKDGKLFAVVHLSDCNDYDLDDAMEKWGNGEEEVSISTLFSLATILDSAIDGHALYGDPANGINANAKPLFDAMRKDLVEMIERIDALKFA